MTFEGDGTGTRIIALNSENASPIAIAGTDISAQAGNGSVIRDMQLHPFAWGDDRFGIDLRFCRNVLVENVRVEHAPDAGGVRMLDCDNCTVDRLSFTQADATASGYAVYMGGCKRCTASNVTAVRPFVAVAIAGQDIDPACTRPSAETFGNTISNCRSSNAESHHFNINGCVGNTVTGCTAEGYDGAGVNWAFQTKDAVGDATRGNVFIGCTAKDVPSGFGGQQSSGTVYVGCTAINVAEYGFVLNSLNDAKISSCGIHEFGLAGIWLGAGSTGNLFDGITLATSTANAKGIVLAGPSNSTNNFDNITTASALAAFIEVDSGCNNNRFGLGCRANDNAIVDLSGTTVWPIKVSTPTFSLTAGGTHYASGGYMHRGMHVATARLLVISAISGTPQVAAGRAGATTSVAASQAVTGGAPSLTNLTMANGLVPTGALLTASCTAVGTAGMGYVQFEGLARL